MFAAVLLCWVAVLFSAPTTRAEEPQTVVFGMSAAFTGANGELGIEFYRGVMAYVEHFNRTHRDTGPLIRILPANDGYNPEPCFNNTVRFIEQDKVFALFSYVGTPTTTRVLPLLQRFSNRHVYMLFPFTGAQRLRKPPFGQYVFNLRASYHDETHGLVDHMVRIGRERIAVFYQSDAYGRTGWDGVRRALKAHGLAIAAEAAYRRGASFEQDFSREVDHLMEARPDAVICVGTYASQGAFIRAMRDRGHRIPVAGLSFADSDKMLELLQRAGEQAGRDYTHDLIHSQVVPSYENLDLPGVRFYRRLMDAAKTVESPGEEGYVPRRFSFVSFEGFLNAVLLGEMLKRMGEDIRPERIPEVLESISRFDLGIGSPASFGPDHHQGLDNVYFTTVRDGRFRTIRSWERWRK